MANGFHLETHERVSSTNNLVKQAIDQDAPEGLVVYASEQTNGYGRQGRVWSSPQGGMYESFLLRPNVALAQVPTIALVAGLSVRAALCELVGSACADESPTSSDEQGVQDDAATGAANSAGACPVMVKWPNDVICAAGKLAGISSEVHNGALCVGIGVNVFPPEHPRSVPGKNVPAYVVDLLGDERMPRAVSETDGLTPAQAALLERVARCVSDSFEVRYAQWTQQGLTPFVDELRRASSLTGQQVRVVTRLGDLLAEGEVAGIDDHGYLLVRTADGMRAVSSGEAHLAADEERA